MAVEDEATAAVMLEQGRLSKRPHSKLDHDHPATKALPIECQFEYEWTTDFVRESVDTKDTLEKGGHGDPGEVEEVPAEEPHCGSTCRRSRLRCDCVGDCNCGSTANAIAKSITHAILLRLRCNFMYIDSEIC